MSYNQGPYNQGSYNQGSYNQGPPQPPYPWIAEWDQQYQRWVFVNRETGQRTHEFPSQSYNSTQGYSGEYNQDNHRQEYEEPQRQSHTGRNVALAAAGGLAGGALLMYEGDKIKNDWDQDKDRFENDAEDFPDNAARSTGQKVQDVEDIPEDVAGWTGRKVQDVEDIHERVEGGFDNAVQDVEDVPGDVAGWTGRKVGEVEDFGDDVDRYGDRVDNAYDDGRDESRYDDDNRY